MIHSHTRIAPLFRRPAWSGLLAAAVCTFGGLSGPRAQAQTPSPVGTVFYILLENRNFSATSVAGKTDTTGGAVLRGNAAAPYINSLITPGNANSTSVSWASAYHNVLATESGSNPSIHPSEPNYLWMESGSNFGVLNDNDPYGSTKQVQVIANYLAANPALSGENLTALLQANGVTWRSYQEGTNLANSNGVNFNTAGGTLTNTVLPPSQWTVPLASFSGTSAGYVNPYNGSHQYNFACKHDGSLFFTATNGSTVTTANTGTYPANPMANNYAPLEQLQADLDSNTVARYVVITPDQYNDMHTALSAGFTYNGTHYTGDLSQIAQGDNFLSMIVPKIMASQAWQNNGVIVIWTDETEGTNQNDFSHTLEEIVISKLAKGGGYESTLNYTHSSDISTMQKIFAATASTPSGYLNDATNPSNAVTTSGDAGAQWGYGTGAAYDLSDMFQPGVIPSTIPLTKISTQGGYAVNRRTNTAVQTVTITNLLSYPITEPVYLVVNNLSSNTTLTNAAGTTQNYWPEGAPYVLASQSGLPAGGSVTVNLDFTVPTTGSISNSLSTISTSGQP